MEEINVAVQVVLGKQSQVSPEHIETSPPDY